MVAIGNDEAKCLVFYKRGDTKAGGNGGRSTDAPSALGFSEPDLDALVSGRLFFVRVYLVRHGQTDWNVRGLAQGHTDIPLSEIGQGQVSLLASAFEEIPITHLFSSDLQRAKQTARVIGEGNRIDPLLRQDLRERSFGEWEGSPYEEVLARIEAQAREEKLSSFQVRPPGGESLEDVWQRVGLLVESLSSLRDNVAIVSHGGTCGALLARLILAPVESVRSFRFGNTAITELERRKDGHYMIARYNDMRHLHVAQIAIGNDGTAQ